ncbi:MAG: hypothetical protein ACYC8W_03225 [Candidatus Tyrphobacter sp.]
MRRLIGSLVIATLVVAPAFARASTLFSATPDLRATLLMRVFGETSDARARLGISNLDARSESPLRAAAFVVSITNAAQTAVDVPVRAPAVVAHFPAAPAQALTYVVSRPPQAHPGVSIHVPVSAPVTSAYEALPPALFASDERSGAFSFPSVSTSSVPSFVTQSALEGTSAPGSGLAQNVQIPVSLRVGNLRVLAGFNAAFGTTPSSGINNTLPVFVPSYSGVSRSSVGAAFAVPVAPRLLLGFGYNTERLITGYGVPATVEGLDARNDTYSGNITFLFPRLSSALSFSAQQYRYQDNLLPAEFTQLRENLNLTVKF